MIEFDPGKSVSNLAKHGVSLEAAKDFDWGTALESIDDREDYDELREIALGFIGVVMHHMTFTRRGENIRVISLRKATKHEIKRYVAQQH